MRWSIEFIPFVPWPVLWALAALGVLLFALLLWRSRRGAILRAASYALILLAIANPHLKQEDREPLNDVVAVVVDETQSQTIAGRDERTEAIRKDLEERLKAIPNLDTRWVHSTSTSADGDRDGTMLFADLGRALADVPPDRLAGAVLITDGNVHDVPGSAAALGFDAPVHALITGKDGEFDRRIEVLKAPRFGIVGGEQIVELKVTETAPNKGSDTVKLSITRQGDTPETRNVRVGETVEVPVKVERAGPNIVEIEAEGAPGELTTVNNRAVLTIEGVRENLRVLLVSGEPHAGERTWRNMLKSDASVDLVHFTILRPPEKQDGTPINQLSLIAFPTRELFQEKLDQFDLIIFDRYQRRGVLPLLYLENVARYVENGGAVLVSAGDDYASPLSLYRTPLGEVLPAVPSGRVLEEPFKPKLTTLGGKHPVTRDLPGAGENPSWGRWFRVVGADPRDAEVLMQGPNEAPLLILGERGKGRVALLLSDHIWLWARGYEGGGPYIDLLRRLAHWLMKEPDLEEETLRADEPRPDAVDRAALDQGRDRDGDGHGAVRQGGDDRPRQGRWRAVAEGRSRRSSKASTASLPASLRASSPSATPMPGSLRPSRQRRRRSMPLLEETGGGGFWLGRTDDEAEAAAARRHDAQRSHHAWRRLDRPAQARRLSRQGRAAVPALHRLPRARPPARADRHDLVPRRALSGARFQQTGGVGERARNELERQQPVGIDRTRQPDLPRRHRIEAEAAVIRACRRPARPAG